MSVKAAAISASNAWGLIRTENNMSIINTFHCLLNTKGCIIRQIEKSV